MGASTSLCHTHLYFFVRLIFLLWTLLFFVLSGSLAQTLEPKLPGVDSAFDQVFEEESDSTKTRRFKNIHGEIWFNRVDGFHLGVKVDARTENRFSPAIVLGYNTGLERWAYGSELQYDLGQNFLLWFELYSKSQKRYNSDYFSVVENSIQTLLALDDYFDYYWRRGASIGLDYRVANAVFKIHFRNEEQTSLAKTTDFDLFGSTKILRPNPAIEEGLLRSVEWTAIYGGEYRPFNRRPGIWAKLSVEYSADELASDFNFTRYHLSADWRLETFFRNTRRPNTLDLRILAGTSKGQTPIQRYGILDVGLWSYAPFGSFRTISGRPYEGKSYLGLYGEHNFSAVIFEILNLDPLLRSGTQFAIHGALGRSWIPRRIRSAVDYSPRFAAGFHREVGLSLIFQKLRLDFTRRFDVPGWTIGFDISPSFYQ